MISRMKRWLWMALTVLYLGWPGQGEKEVPLLPAPLSCMVLPSRGTPSPGANENKKDDEDGDSVGRKPK